MIVDFVSKPFSLVKYTQPYPRSKSVSTVLMPEASVTIAAHFDGATYGYHEKGFQRPRSEDARVTYTFALSTAVSSKSGAPMADTVNGAGVGAGVGALLVVGVGAHLDPATMVKRVGDSPPP
jgi:hypothetical protein